MSDDFVKHLEHASSVVQTWPKWRQEILGGDSSECIEEESKVENPEKLAQEVAKYAFALAFALGFRQDEALLHHNAENLKYWTNCLLQEKDNG